MPLEDMEDENEFLAKKTYEIVKFGTGKVHSIELLIYEINSYVEISTIRPRNTDIFFDFQSF